MKGHNVRLEVNGKPLKLNLFVQELIANVVKGILQSLKGAENPEELFLHIRYEKGQKTIETK